MIGMISTDFRDSSYSCSSKAQTPRRQLNKAGPSQGRATGGRWCGRPTAEGESNIATYGKPVILQKGWGSPTLFANMGSHSAFLSWLNHETSFNSCHRQRQRAQLHSCSQNSPFKDRKQNLHLVDSLFWLCQLVHTNSLRITDEFTLLAKDTWVLCNTAWSHKGFLSQATKEIKLPWITRQPSHYPVQRSVLS